MDYIALKGRIEQAIQSRPLDIEAYNDLTCAGNMRRWTLSRRMNGIGLCVLRWVTACGLP